MELVKERRGNLYTGGRVPGRGLWQVRSYQGAFDVYVKMDGRAVERMGLTWDGMVFLLKSLNFAIPSER